MVAAAGEPLADTSCLPMYYLCGFTRQNVTVALSGDGGDECFAGYETYVADKLHRTAAHSPRWLRERVHGVLDRLLPVDHRKLGWPEKARRLTGALAQDFPALTRRGATSSTPASCSRSCREAGASKSARPRA
jgi:asparagine synthase (glutamine-hydrolysing)